MVRNLYQIKQQLKSCAITDVLNQYQECERTLSIENRLTRLAVLSKVLFDEEMSGECLQEILDITNQSCIDSSQALTQMVLDLK